MNLFGFFKRKRWPYCTEIKKARAMDKAGHYDVDGVSFDVTEGVVVAGDGDIRISLERGGRERKGSS